MEDMQRLDRSIMSNHGVQGNDSFDKASFFIAFNEYAERHHLFVRLSPHKTFLSSSLFVFGEVITNKKSGDRITRSELRYYLRKIFDDAAFFDWKVSRNSLVGYKKSTTGLRHQLICCTMPKRMDLQRKLPIFPVAVFLDLSAALDALIEGRIPVKETKVISSGLFPVLAQSTTSLRTRLSSSHSVEKHKEFRQFNLSINVSSSISDWL